MWNRVVGAGRWAKPIVRYNVAVGVYRIGQVVWALMCVDWCTALMSNRLLVPPHKVDSTRIFQPRNHSLKVSSQSSRLELRRNHFSVRVVKPWNELPEAVVCSPSVKVFESRLDKLWKSQPVGFGYIDLDTEDDVLCPELLMMMRKISTMTVFERMPNRYGLSGQICDAKEVIGETVIIAQSSAMMMCDGLVWQAVAAAEFLQYQAAHQHWTAAAAEQHHHPSKTAFSSTNLLNNEIFTFQWCCNTVAVWLSLGISLSYCTLSWVSTETGDNSQADHHDI